MKKPSQTAGKTPSLTAAQSSSSVKGKPTPTPSKAFNADDYVTAILPKEEVL
jgi:hypothetical protein